MEQTHDIETGTLPSRGSIDSEASTSSSSRSRQIQTDDSTSASTSQQPVSESSIDASSSIEFDDPELKDLVKLVKHPDGDYMIAFVEEEFAKAFQTIKRAKAALARVDADRVAVATVQHLAQIAARRSFEEQAAEAIGRIFCFLFLAGMTVPIILGAAGTIH